MVILSAVFRGGDAVPLEKSFEFRVPEGEFERVLREGDASWTVTLPGGESGQRPDLELRRQGEDVPRLLPQGGADGGLPGEPPPAPLRAGEGRSVRVRPAGTTRRDDPPGLPDPNLVAKVGPL